MRKVIILASCAAALLASCQTNLSPEESIGGKVKIDVTAAIDNVSKTALSIDEDGKYGFTWCEGDYVTVYQEAGSEMEFYDCKIPSETQTAEFTAEFAPIAPQQLRYYASYPAPNRWVTNAEPDRIFLDMPSNQFLYDGTFDPAADLMVSDVVETTEQPELLEFKFARLGGLLKLTMTGLAPGAKIKEGTIFFDKPVAGLLEYHPVEMTYSGQDCMFHINLISEYGDELVADGDGNVTIWLRTFPAEFDEFFISLNTEVSGEDVWVGRRVVISEHAGASPIPVQNGKITDLSAAIADVAVTGVALAPEEVTIGVEESIRLNVILTPREATARVMWLVEDEGIASINEDGVITGWKAGKCMFAAYAANLDGSPILDEYGDPLYFGLGAVTVSSGSGPDSGNRVIIIGDAGKPISDDEIEKGGSF